jgi:hypothetical protein
MVTAFPTVREEEPKKVPERCGCGQNSESVRDRRYPEPRNLPSAPPAPMPTCE